MTDGMVTYEELIAEHMQDPEFAAEWKRTALAREIAIAIIRYRTDHDLTQAQLARRSGLSQPQISNLEVGERQPKLETLTRMAAALGMRLHIDVGAEGDPVVELREPCHAQQTDAA